MTVSEQASHLKAEIEQYISVDIESSGPEPGKYALLSIGACRVADPHQGFYVELQPDRTGFTPEAMSVSDLSLETLAHFGVPAPQAMQQFDDWLKIAVPDHKKPVFVAFNAPFDWMFVNDYFLRYLNRNPFGHSALDIKAFYMGFKCVPWSETSYHRIATHYGLRDSLLHHALEDARDQARLFSKMLNEVLQ